jgi:CRISPR/Cas system-associated endonuclease Cas1
MKPPLPKISDRALQHYTQYYIELISGLSCLYSSQLEAMIKQGQNEFPLADEGQLRDASYQAIKIVFGQDINLSAVDGWEIGIPENKCLNSKTD